MIPKISRIITKASMAVFGVSLLAMFVLDSFYYNNSATHVRNPLVGRVFEHSIKFSSPIYLTRREYEPYVWIYIALAACGVLLAASMIIEAIAKRVQRSHSSGQ